MKKEVQSSRDLAKSKEALNECIQQTKTIEIHFNENDSSKSVLTRVNFPFDPEVYGSLELEKNYSGLCLDIRRH